MTTQKKKQFGIWMDGHHAIVAGNVGSPDHGFKILGQVDHQGAGGNSNENAANHQEVTVRHKFFKEIAAIMPNVDEVHLTGTGQAQEQFKHFLADTAQYKNVLCTESTSNKMGEEQFLAFMGKHFNG